MKKLITSIALFAISTIAFAQEVKWDTMEVSSQKMVLDDLATFDGFGFSGTTLLTNNVLLTFSKRKLDGDFAMRGFNIDMKFDQVSFGIGGRSEISENTDFFFTVQHVKLALKTSINQYSMKIKDTGTGAQMGIRSMVSNNLELTAYLNHLDVSGSSTSVVYGGHYHLASNFSLGMTYEKDSDEKTASLIARMYF